jgi:hypothetical protein
MTTGIAFAQPRLIGRSDDIRHTEQVRLFKVGSHDVVPTGHTSAVCAQEAKRPSLALGSGLQWRRFLNGFTEKRIRLRFYDFQLTH